MDIKDPNLPEEEPQERPEQADEKTEQPDNAEPVLQEDPQITALKQQLEESRNKYLYLASDFENYKRNAGRERMELIQTAGRDILAAMLPILDDFDRAAKNDGLNDGINLIYHKLQSTLEHKGLKSLAAQAGDEFNADIHEAVAEIPAASEEHKGKIVDIVEQGYQLGERIIRFAKVVVGR